MKTSQCLSYREEEKQEDEDEKKEDDDEEEEIEGKRRDEEDMQDSLVMEKGMIVKFPVVFFTACVLPLHLLLQGSFQQEEVKQPHQRDTQRPCQLPPFPVSPNSAATEAKTSQENQACLNTCWWSMEPAVPQKYCKTYTWAS